MTWIPRVARCVVIGAVLACLLFAGNGVVFAGSHSGGPPTVASGSAGASAGAPSAPAVPALRVSSAAPSAAALSWWNISSESATRAPGFWFTQGTWDAAEGSLILYGGDNWHGTNLADTWSYSHGSWTKVATPGSPGPLDGPALAYDPVSREVVMYGGLASYGPPFIYTNLTWVYSAGNWTSSHHHPTPPPRLAASMVYDPDLGGVVLFGGYNNIDPSGNTLLNDLWLYKAGNWSVVPAATPPTVRTWPSLTYDPSTHALVLFSGVTATYACIGDSWTFSSGKWSRVAVPAGPLSSTCASAIGYDPDVGHVILAGGWNTSGAPTRSTWLFNGTAWLPLGTIGAPSYHIYGVSAWDPDAHAFVLAGGWTGTTVTDLLSAPLAVANLTGPSTAEVGQAVQFQAGAMGGVPQRTFHWSWGDGSSATGAQSPPHAYAAAGTYTVGATVTDAALNVAHANATIVVVTGPAPHVIASPNLGDVGSPVNFSGSVAGGSGGSVFAWTFGDGASGVGATSAHTYTKAGTYNVTLQTTDSVGGVGSTTLVVIIDPAPTVHFAGGVKTEVGVSVHLNATTSGGVLPYFYVWRFDDGGLATTATVGHAFARAGAHNVNLTIRDAVNVTSSARLVVTVAAGPTVIVNGPGSLTSGTSGTWTADVAGGTAPYEVFWTFPGGGNATGVTASHAFSVTGDFVVHIRVADALGANGSTVQNVSVRAPSTILGGTVGGVPTLALVGIAVVVVVAAAAVVVMMRRRTVRPPPDE